MMKLRTIMSDVQCIIMHIIIYVLYVCIHYSVNGTFPQYVVSILDQETYCVVNHIPQ